MKFIICIDDNNGMLFFGRRQSQDSVLRKKILEMTAASRLFMSEYSAKQFEDKENIIIDDNYLQNAGMGDYCFVENCGYDIKRADEIILCNWNRHYPADVFFDFPNGEFTKISCFDLAGSSHDKITIEIYGRE